MTEELKREINDLFDSKLKVEQLETAISNLERCKSNLEWRISGRKIDYNILEDDNNLPLSLVERLRYIKDIIEVDLSFLEKARNRLNKELDSFKKDICMEIQDKFKVLPYIYPYSNKQTVNDSLIIYPLITFRESYYNQRLQLEFREEHSEIQQFVDGLLQSRDDITLESDAMYIVSLFSKYSSM